MFAGEEEGHFPFPGRGEKKDLYASPRQIYFGTPSRMRQRGKKGRKRSTPFSYLPGRKNGGRFERKMRGLRAGGKGRIFHRHKGR